CLVSTYFLTYFLTAFGPTSAPYMLPAASTAIPSAALVPVAFSSGSGMKPRIFPSFRLPQRIPRFQPSWLRDTDSDSESATYRMSFLSTHTPLGRLNWR